MDFSFQETDLVTLLKQVAAEFSSSLNDKSLTLQIEVKNEGATSANIDGQRIKQVVRNLISNALKFSPEGASVEVRLSCRNREVCIEVRDHGVGIPEGELQSIFEKFVQSSNTKNGAGGTGLGLSISREIAFAHRGKVWAENAVDGGACFFLTFPPAMAQEGPANDEWEMDVSQKRVS